MVFFSCDACGDVLKKAQVDAHVGRCRSGNCESVSCVDCSVYFYGDDYRQHTSCISEAERYEKSVYRGPAANGKRKKSTATKPNPQQVWMDLIKSATLTAPATMQPRLMELVGYDNVPRKEKQFRNFATNSLRGIGRNREVVVGQIWDHLVQCRDEQRRKKDENDGGDGGDTTGSNSRKQPNGLQDGSKGFDDKRDERCIVTNTNVACTNLAMEVKDSRDKTGNEKHRGKNDESRRSDDSIRRNEPTNCDESVSPLNQGGQGQPSLNATAVIKMAKQILKRAPGQRMKVKELRRKVRSELFVQEKGHKRELKRLMNEQLTSNPKKIKIDGRHVFLAPKQIKA